MNFFTTQADGVLIFIQMWEYLSKNYELAKPPTVNIDDGCMTFTVTPNGLTGILAEVKDLTINMMV